MTLTELKYDVLASIFMKPATLQELNAREFLKNCSEYVLDRILMILERNEYAYEKEGKYYAYKKTLKILNKRGYELSDPDKIHDTRTEFAKQVQKLLNQ